MNRETLEKGNELQKDIDNITGILKDHNKHKWIRVISPDNKDIYYSVRFQNDLGEWLETKRKEYQEELDRL